MKSKPLEIKPEDLEKLNRNRARRESIAVDEEQLFIAEFGKHYGWGGVDAILENKISGETAVWLMQGARKIDYKYLYDSARAVLIGTGSAQAKKPSSTFKSATRAIQKVMKADL